MNLALYKGKTLDCVQRTIWGNRDTTQVDSVEGKNSKLHKCFSLIY